MRLARPMLLVCALFGACASEGEGDLTLDVPLADGKSDVLINRRLTTNFTGSSQLGRGIGMTVTSLVHDVTDNSFTVDGPTIEIGRLDGDTEITIENEHWYSEQDVMFLFLYKDRMTRDTWSPAFVNYGYQRIALYRSITINAAQRTLSGVGYHWEQYPD